MPWELIFTDALRGFRPGSRGYCTVAQTADIPLELSVRLEKFSRYNHLHRRKSSEPTVWFSRNPVVASYRVVDIEGQRNHVLSRMSDAGAASTRTNYLARHLVFTAGELADLPSPAIILKEWPGWRLPWTGAPRILAKNPPGLFKRSDSRPLLPAREWKRITGDERRAAGLLVPPCSKGCFLQVPEGHEEGLLDLFAETLETISIARGSSLAAWQYPFTTFFQAEDNQSDFLWRGGWPHSPGWDQEMQRGGLSRTPGSVPIPDDELASVARNGRLPRPAPPRDHPPRKTPNASGTPLPRARPSTSRLVISDHHIAQASSSADRDPPSDPALNQPVRRRRWQHVALMGATVAAVVLACVLVWPKVKSRFSETPVPLGNAETPPLTTNHHSQSETISIASIPAREQVILLQLAEKLEGGILDLPNQFPAHGEHVSRLLRLVGQIEESKLSPSNVACYVMTTNTVTLTPPMIARPGTRGPGDAVLGFGLGGLRRFVDSGVGSELTYKEDPDARWSNGFASLTFRWKELDSPITNDVTLWFLNPGPGPGKASPMTLNLTQDLTVNQTGAGPYSAFGAELADFLSKTVLPLGRGWALDLYTSTNATDRPVYSGWTKDLELSRPKFGDELSFKANRGILAERSNKLAIELKEKEAQRNALTNVAGIQEQVELAIGPWFGVPETYSLHSFLSYWCARTDSATPEEVLQQYLRSLLRDYTLSANKAIQQAGKNLERQFQRPWPANPPFPKPLADFQDLLTLAGHLPSDRVSLTNTLLAMRSNRVDVLIRYRSLARLNKDLEHLKAKQERLFKLIDEIPVNGLNGVQIHHAILRIIQTNTEAKAGEGVDFIRFIRPNASTEVAP